MVSTATDPFVVDADRPLLLPSFARRLLLIGWAAGVVAITLGVSVLVGYAIRSPAVVRLAPSLPPMYPNAALALICGGSAALLVSRVGVWQRAAAVTLSGVVAAIGIVGLGLHLVSAEVGWYEALWPSDPFVEATTPTPGRPVAETCVALTLVGVALVLVAVGRAPRTAQAFAFGTVTVGSAAIIGFMIGVDRARLGGSLVTVGMALHTAIGLAALGLAALFSRPSVGVLGLLGDAGDSGRVGRRLVLAAVAAPVVLVTINALLARTVSDSALATSILAVVQVAAIGALVVVPLAVMERAEWQSSEAARTERRRTEAAGDDRLVVQTLADEVLAAPQLPEGWRVGFCQEPAEGFLAGDSQQVLVRDDGRFLVAVIDVAGHGTAAAVDALRLRTEVAALWQHHVGPAEIARTLNRTMLDRSTIASAVLLSVEQISGEVEYVNAGHPPPLHLSGRRTLELRRTGLILGVVEADYDTAATTLGPTDLLVLYTDGITEARNGSGEELGPDELRSLVRTRAAEGPQAVAQACADAALQHTVGRLRDDALVVALQRA